MTVFLPTGQKGSLLVDSLVVQDGPLAHPLPSAVNRGDDLYTVHLVSPVAQCGGRLDPMADGNIFYFVAGSTMT